MGVRSQRAYETENRKAFDAFPWRERMRARLPGLLLVIIIVIIMVELAVALVVSPFIID